MTVYNIRGTSGSGKTHLVRQLVNHYQGREIRDKEGKIFGYELPHHLRILGRYDSAIKGGGVDNITGALFKRFQAAQLEGNTMDAVEAQVRKWHGLGHHVLFEGLIVTSIWGRWVKMAQDLPTFFLFLDTPLETCYQRVLQRSGGRTPKGYPGNSDMEYKHRQQAKQVSSIQRKHEEASSQVASLERPQSSMEDFHYRQAKRHIPKAMETGLRYEILDHTRAFERMKEIVEDLT